jgi:hypothetical protein
MSHALIQLVSEQTLPNLLPALVLRPARVVLCHSRRTAPRTRALCRALDLAGVSIELCEVSLSDNPEILETADAVRAAIEAAVAAGLDPVVNFTCGTKLMGVGAFAAAHKTKTPSLYVDSDRTRLVDGHTGPLPATLQTSEASLRLAADLLTVDLVATAHGIDSISAGRDPSPFLPLADHLLRHPAEERLLCSSLTSMGNPRRPAEVLRALSTPIAQLLPTTFALARDAGILTGHPDSPRLTRPASLGQLEAWAAGERYQPAEWAAAFSPLQENINILGGGWWELAVFAAAQASARFRDLRWSVAVCSAGQTFEKDLVALEGLNLAVISCKRGGEKSRLVAAIDELDSTARQLGGSHARRYLAVAQAIPRSVFASVQERARQTQTTLIGPAAGLSPGSFA